VDESLKILDNSLKQKIVNALEPIGIQKIVLFGSYAYGIPSDNSDIDLLVVTTDNFIPPSFSEKQKISIKINNALSFVRKSFPLDLIVHTKPMYRNFIIQNSAFQREISSKGVVLYEKNN
jgi:predicted nucleotidyltransferase